jgi:hypothetical protein
MKQQIKFTKEFLNLSSASPMKMLLEEFNKEDFPDGFYYYITAFSDDRKQNLYRIIASDMQLKNIVGTINEDHAEKELSEILDFNSHIVFDKTKIKVGTNEDDFIYNRTSFTLPVVSMSKYVP